MHVQVKSCYFWKIMAWTIQCRWALCLLYHRIPVLGWQKQPPMWSFAIAAHPPEGAICHGFWDAFLLTMHRWTLAFQPQGRGREKIVANRTKTWSHIIVIRLDNKWQICCVTIITRTNCKNKDLRPEWIQTHPSLRWCLSKSTEIHLFLSFFWRLM